MYCVLCCNVELQKLQRKNKLDLQLNLYCSGLYIISPCTNVLYSEFYCKMFEFSNFEHLRICTFTLFFGRRPCGGTKYSIYNDSRTWPTQCNTKKIAEKRNLGAYTAHTIKCRRKILTEMQDMKVSSNW